MRLRSVMFVLPTLMAVASAAAQASDVKILTAGAMKEVVLALAPAFEKRTGNHLAISNDTVGGLARRIRSGEAVDVAILTPRALADLDKDGLVAAGSATNVASVGIGVAVRDGAQAPAISTAAEFKQALLDARSVAYVDPKAGGSSGIYFDQLLSRLGIAEVVHAKARLSAGGFVAQKVASGEADLAISQISEIVPVKGVKLVGPLPPDLQNTTTYAAAIGAKSSDAAAAKAFLLELRGPAAAAALAGFGMTPAP